MRSFSFFSFLSFFFVFSFSALSEDGPLGVPFAFVEWTPSFSFEVSFPTLEEGEVGAARVAAVGPETRAEALEGGLVVLLGRVDGLEFGVGAKAPGVEERRYA
jgi:hypothetical protein